MVCGVPFMCMSTIGVMSSAAVASMRGSNSPPETSLIQSAPAATAARATAAFLVSTLMVAPGARSRMARTTGATRLISSSTGTSVAPGRVDSPPTSRMSAPASSMACAAATASSARACLPPSLKESGVAFTTPMRSVRSLRRQRAPSGRPCRPPARGKTRSGQAPGLVLPWMPLSSSLAVGMPSNPGWRHCGQSSAKGSSTKSRSCINACGTSRGCSPQATLSCASPTATMSRSTTRGPWCNPGLRPSSASIFLRSNSRPWRSPCLAGESSNSATAFRNGGCSVTYCAAVKYRLEVPRSRNPSRPARRRKARLRDLSRSPRFPPRAMKHRPLLPGIRLRQPSGLAFHGVGRRVGGGTPMCSCRT
mmetsp:Transcript_24581/g.76545  ORF Transcript_24581/g.76545 Transcript_24581/m.76545 type:complete len:364 (+) Transcript_24581:470-1561(+)